MMTSLSLALLAALLLPACADDSSQAKAGAKAGAVAAAPAAPASAPAAAAQDAAKPEATPQPQSDPKPQPEAAPAAPAAASEESESMTGTQKLLDPKHPDLNQKAPDTFRAKFETNEGTFTIEVTRAWAPLGADRFYNLVKNGYYDDARFFRVLDGFMAQFGIHGDPKVSAAWRGARIQDDPVTQSNTRGMVTFAMGGKDTRTTQLFINYVDNGAALDRQGFPPFGKVVEGMEVVDKFYKAYGEGAPRGPGPDQGRLQMEGNAYLAKSFPELDYIVKATIVE
jgi:peptidyl-prolyl cis-trans isomerase A (cyclophilin A)